MLTKWLDNFHYQWCKQGVDNVFFYIHILDTFAQKRGHYILNIFREFDTSEAILNSPLFIWTNLQWIKNTREVATVFLIFNETQFLLQSISS